MNDPQLAAPHALSANMPAVVDFFEAGVARDTGAMMRLFTSDAIYHNMPEAPLVGAEAIRAAFEEINDGAQSVEIAMLAIAETDSGAVMTKRRDCFVSKGRPLAHCPWLGLAP